MRMSYFHLIQTNLIFLKQPWSGTIYKQLHYAREFTLLSNIIPPKVDITILTLRRET